MTPSTTMTCSTASRARSKRSCPGLSWPRMASLLDLIEQYAPALESIGSASPPSPRWDQDWFPRLDAAAAYAMVRSLRPRRIVEVGSGHSTRFLARALADGGLDTKITAIDPRPRARITGLPVEWLQTHVETLDWRP